ILAGDPGIDFQANLRTRSESKALFGVEKKILELRRTKVRRGAAPPVKLDDLPRSIQAAGDPVYFLLERLNVGMCDLVMPVYYYIAAAKQARAVTERKVHVERERAAWLRGVRFLERFLKFDRTETVEPLRRGGIAGVPRTGNVVSLNQFCRYSDGLGLEIDRE